MCTQFGLFFIYALMTAGAARRVWVSSQEIRYKLSNINILAAAPEKNFRRVGWRYNLFTPR